MWQGKDADIHNITEHLVRIKNYDYLGLLQQWIEPRPAFQPQSHRKDIVWFVKSALYKSFKKWKLQNGSYRDCIIWQI